MQADARTGVDQPDLAGVHVLPVDTWPPGIAGHETARVRGEGDVAAIAGDGRVERSAGGVNAVGDRRRDPAQLAGVEVTPVDIGLLVHVAAGQIRGERLERDAPAVCRDDRTLERRVAGLAGHSRRPVLEVAYPDPIARPSAAEIARPAREHRVAPVGAQAARWSAAEPPAGVRHA